ncbi:MAG: class I SAM-dependent methyltransferase [Polyangiales bacterium]
MAKVPLGARPPPRGPGRALRRRAAALLRASCSSRAPTQTREAITARVFAAEDTYAPGGPTYEQGLFAWERAALAHASVPASGRVLLGGAGGGRELKALAAMGYEVVAFEPSDGLVDALTAVAREVGATALQGSYRDLARAKDGVGLAVLSEQRFDLVVLGWASFAHLTDDDDRRALFVALRALAPDAPVLISYLGPDDDPRWNGRVAALRARCARRSTPCQGEGCARARASSPARASTDDRPPTRSRPSRARRARGRAARAGPVPPRDRHAVDGVRLSRPRRAGARPRAARGASLRRGASTCA